MLARKDVGLRAKALTRPTILFHLSNSQRFAGRIGVGAPARTQFCFAFPSRKLRGGWSAERRFLCVHARVRGVGAFCGRRSPLGAPSRRFCVPRAARIVMGGFGAADFAAARPASSHPASSSRMGRSAHRAGPRGLPSAGVTSSPARGRRRPRSIRRTSPEDAPRRAGMCASIACWVV